MAGKYYLRAVVFLPAELREKDNNRDVYTLAGCGIAAFSFYGAGNARSLFPGRGCRKVINMPF